jgi:hypothetical protein
VDWQVGLVGLVAMVVGLERRRLVVDRIRNHGAQTQGNQQTESEKQANSGSKTAPPKRVKITSGGLASRWHGGPRWYDGLAAQKIVA